MLAIPLYDDTPKIHMPLTTAALVAACSLVFLWQIGLPPRTAERAMYSYDMIPAVLLCSAELPARLQIIPSWLTLITCQFLHAGQLHLWSKYALPLGVRTRCGKRFGVRQISRALSGQWGCGSADPSLHESHRRCADDRSERCNRLSAWRLSHFEAARQRRCAGLDLHFRPPRQPARSVPPRPVVPASACKRSVDDAG